MKKGKKPKKPKQLKLLKQTMRVLSKSELDEVAGGDVVYRPGCVGTSKVVR